MSNKDLGPLNFNVSSTGLSLTGGTSSVAEIEAFIERLKDIATLAPKLWEQPAQPLPTLESDDE